MKNNRYFYQVTTTNTKDNFNTVVEITEQEFKTQIKRLAIHYVKEDYESFAPLQEIKETKTMIEKQEIIEYKNGIIEILTIFEQK